MQEWNVAHGFLLGGLGLAGHAAVEFKGRESALEHGICMSSTNPWSARLVLILIYVGSVVDSCCDVLRPCLVTVLSASQCIFFCPRRNSVENNGNIFWRHFFGHVGDNLCVCEAKLASLAMRRACHRVVLPRASALKSRECPHCLKVCERQKHSLFAREIQSVPCLKLSEKSLAAAN